jgi:hypothetical protein
MAIGRQPSRWQGSDYALAEKTVPGAFKPLEIGGAEFS